MKISQEAREAARIIMDSHQDAFPIWLGRAIEAVGDDEHPLLACLQSLINSTLERAAVVADAAGMRGFRTGEAQTYIVTAIRQLIEE